MLLLTRIKRAIGNPVLLTKFAKRKISETILLAWQWRIGALMGSIVTGVTGWSPYDYYLMYRERTLDEPLVCSIDGLEMTLDLGDSGISRELFLYRTREQTTVELFERELQALRDEIDGPIRVLEIGANIGYFALIEARALGERAEIHAFEPDSRNMSLLRENIARNNYTDRIRVDLSAIGPKTGHALLQRSTHSNRNRIAPDGGESYTKALSLTGETSPVDVWSVDDYLSQNSVSPDSINVIRMDVEGYETEILRGMDAVLQADEPLVLFMEVHPHFFSEAEYQWLMATLDSVGFEIIDAISEKITARPFDGSLGVEGMHDLCTIDENGYKLIAKRSGTEDNL